MTDINNSEVQLQMSSFSRTGVKLRMVLTMYRARLAVIVPLLLGTTLLAGCDRASRGGSSPAPREGSRSSLGGRPLINVSFSHPIDNVVTTKYRQPLMDYLTANTPYRFRALLRDDSEKTVGMLEQRLADIAHLGVVSYLEAHSQFGAAPLVRPLNRDGEPYSRSVLVTQRGSTIRRLADLRGRSLALGSFHSTLSNLIPRHELIQAGVTPEALGAIEHLANDEDVITAVLEGRFDAGAVEDIVADRHKEKGLQIFHVSGPIPSAPLVIHSEIPDRVTVAIRDALLKLDIQGAHQRQQWDEQIRFGFAPATDADYEPIRRIIATTPTGCQQACHGIP